MDEVVGELGRNDPICAVITDDSAPTLIPDTERDFDGSEYRHIRFFSDSINAICLAHGPIRPELLHVWLDVMIKRAQERDVADWPTFIGNINRIMSCCPDLVPVVIEAGNYHGAFHDEVTWLGFCDFLLGIQEDCVDDCSEADSDDEYGGYTARESIDEILRFLRLEEEAMK
jgi:hypothetical protein